MQNRQKTINLLGLAERAGKLITGTEMVLAQISRNKIKMIIVASDTQKNSLEKIKRAAKSQRIPLVNSFTAIELSQAIGKKRKVLGLTDAGFAKALAKRINEGV